MDSSNKKVRVRFAPSPTGYLHVGGARTALYNWLFARQNKGVFVLRIEDTDQQRHNEEAVAAIIEGMKWLGMDWDEGPFYQSQRMELYKKYCDRLIEEGKAYYCYCTADELSAQRKEAEERKEAPKYSGKCRCLTKEQIDQFEKEGRSRVVRLKTPQEGATIVKDLIRDDIRFENELLDDFVITKSDGFPTYNFAVVIDDHLMEISHVIRGDDHLSNTPRQVLLYQALGFDVPKFAHIPMILGPDKTRLSKRHGATSVIEYKKMGFLSEAMINYLARLGWGHGDREIFSRQELIDLFNISRVNKTSAVFDIEKLTWMNASYIRQMTPEILLEKTRNMLESAYPSIKDIESTPEGKERIKKIVVCLQERMRTLNDIVGLSDFFFLDEIKYDPQSSEKHLKEEGVKEILTGLAKALETVAPFTKENIEPVFRNLAKEMGIKAGKVIHPARVALTGRSDSPPMFDTVELIGKGTSLKRLNEVISSKL